LTDPVGAKPKREPSRAMLALLTVLFVISYVILTLLVVEQNTTILSQRWLIRDMLHDSNELFGIKAKAAMKAQEQNQAKTQAQAQAHATAPRSSQKEQEKNDKVGKNRKRTFEKPPKAASDTPDVRRALITI
jgi:hypothetical protein